MRVAYLVTEDWYFLSHRLPVARAARDAGHEVVVITRDNGRGGEITAEGFRLVALDWKRGDASPTGLARDIARVVAAFRAAAPDLVHLVAMKPILVGGLARLVVGRPPAVAAFTGLGHTFTWTGARAALMRAVLKIALVDPRVRLLFQNADDRGEVLGAMGLAPERATIVSGSGVDTAHFVSLPEPATAPPTIAMVARMLRSKGVEDLVAAARRLRDRDVAHRLVLAGTPDPESHESLTEAEVGAFAREPGVETWGHVADVRTVWREASIAVLAQRDREGLPKSLLEAAACGRPLVATDVPGCREIARDGETGLLVPPSDPDALADALERLLLDADARRRMGAAARRAVEAEFSADAVARATLALYGGIER